MRWIVDIVPEGVRLKRERHASYEREMPKRVEVMPELSSTNPTKPAHQGVIIRERKPERLPHPEFQVRGFCP